MALIECPDCSRQVSDRAGSCPQCGYHFGNTTGTPLTKLPRVLEKKPATKTGKVLQFVGIVFFLLGVLSYSASMHDVSPDVSRTSLYLNVLFFVLGIVFFACGKFVATGRALPKIALVKCPDCSRQFSDRAESCPQCGYPFGNTPETPLSELPKVVDKKKPASKTGKVLQRIGMVLFLLGVSSCALSLKIDSSDLQVSLRSSMVFFYLFGIVFFVGGRFLEWWYTE